MGTTAELIVKHFLLSHRKIGNSMIQFHIIINLFQHLIVQNAYAGSIILRLNFLLFPKIHLLDIAAGKHIHILLQNILQTFFIQIILPVELLQFIDRNCHNIFKSTVFFLKRTINYPVVNPINPGNNIHCIFSMCQCINAILNSSNPLCCQILTSIQIRTEHMNLHLAK